MKTLTIHYDPYIKYNLYPDAKAMAFAEREVDSFNLVKDGEVFSKQIISISQEIIFQAFRVLIKRGKLSHEEVNFSWIENDQLVTTTCDKDAGFITYPPIGNELDLMLCELLEV